MKISIRKGFGFGLASGVITTLGLIIGLNSSAAGKAVILSGIFVIAVADALSDALGIHISEEAENRHAGAEVWEATAATFLSKLVFALSFALPVIFLSLKLSIIVNIAWGYFLITIFSFYVAGRSGIKAGKVIVEHLLIATAVIIITNYVGRLAAGF